MANELTLNGAGRTLDAEVNGLLNLAASLEAFGVRKATMEGGAHYQHDKDGGVTVIAAPGLRVMKSRAVLHIALPLPGASPEEVLAELRPATQEQRGAVLGLSQQQVSDCESSK